jgi:hypothetical protein
MRMRDESLLLLSKTSCSGVFCDFDRRFYFTGAVYCPCIPCPCTTGTAHHLPHHPHRPHSATPCPQHHHPGSTYQRSYSTQPILSRPSFAVGLLGYTTSARSSIPAAMMRVMILKMLTTFTVRLMTAMTVEVLTVMSV